MADSENLATATVQKPVLPATFANSVRPRAPSPAPCRRAQPSSFADLGTLLQFWSSDYRTGLLSLFTGLQAAVVQSEELAAHVETRIRLERTLANGLVPPALRMDGFALGPSTSPSLKPSTAPFFYS